MTNVKILSTVSRLLDEAISHAEVGTNTFKYQCVSSDDEASVICAACSGFANVTWTNNPRRSMFSRNVFTFEVTLKPLALEFKFKSLNGKNV